MTESIQLHLYVKKEVNKDCKNNERKKKNWKKDFENISKVVV